METLELLKVKMEELSVDTTKFYKGNKSKATKAITHGTTMPIPRLMRMAMSYQAGFLRILTDLQTLQKMTAKHPI